MVQEIYLDNNATTKPLPEVRSAIAEVLGDGFGNPSSSHSAGDRARNHLRLAREAVSALIGGEPDNLIFTSGGTEANNIVLLSAATHQNGRRPRIVTTATEHSSIMKLIEPLRDRDLEVVTLPVDRGGRIDIEQAKREITESTTLVSVHWVNNETGVIQPIEHLAEICKSKQVPLHTDAAQAVGKLPINVGAHPIDFLTMTAQV